jgi:hypothetical protein
MATLTELIANPETKTDFDPRTEVSADAKYIVKQLVLWFLVFPPVVAFLIWVIYNLVYAATNSVH